MHLRLPVSMFRFFLLGCLLQILSAAPTSTNSNANLPFEVDIDSDNTGLDNGLTAQASKQGDKFVASPKPADSEGFSFDSPPQINTSASYSKPTRKPSLVTSAVNPSPIADSVSDAALETSQTITPSNKKKRKPTGEISVPSVPQDSTSAIASMMEDPFFAYMLQDFVRQQQQLMNLLSSMGMPPSGNPFGNALFPMPSISDLQNSMNLDNMELVEDKVLDDTNGNGHIKTYKTKDGSALIQTVTYNLSDDGVKNLVGGSGIGPQTGQTAALAPASRTPSPRLSPMNMFSPLSRRMRVH